MTAPDDPRVPLRHSLDQAAKVVSGVAPDQLHAPTPCSAFDVEALLHHLVFVGQRIEDIGRAQARSAPGLDVTTPAQGWAAAFDEARRAAVDAWDDDGLLAVEHDLGWAAFAGDVVVRIYTLEVVAHTWDLAKATGQLAGLDPELAEVALAVAPAVLPAEPRGGEIPFDPVVAVAPGAPAYDRLAGFLGRRP